MCLKQRQFFQCMNVWMYFWEQEKGGYFFNSKSFSCSFQHLTNWFLINLIYINHLICSINIISCSKYLTTYLRYCQCPFTNAINTLHLILGLNVCSSGIEGNPTVFYRLMPGSTAQTNKFHTFYLQQRPDNGDTWADIKVNHPLDYESIKEYNLTIRVEVSLSTCKICKEAETPRKFNLKLVNVCTIFSRQSKVFESVLGPIRHVFDFCIWEWLPNTFVIIWFEKF